MDELEQERNSCYTYFKMTGDFDPDEITGILGLSPDKQWRIGDLRGDGTAHNFAMWQFGRCDVYDIDVENQMMQTLGELFQRVEELKKIKQECGAQFFLEIVPSVYVGETSPCLAPNREVIRFCYETGTELDIDLYVLD